MMTDSDLYEHALKHLNLVLGFFPRAESRLSLVLGIDLGMLALLGGNAPPLSTMSYGAIALFSIPSLLVVLSTVEVYRGLFPNLDGGEKSLIYFRRVGELTEVLFVEEMRAQTIGGLARDLMGQVWANSKILRMKFDRLRTAFLLMAFAVPPWVIALAAFLAHTTQTTAHLLTR